MHEVENELVLLPRYLDRIDRFFSSAYYGIDTVCIPSYSIDYLPIMRENIINEGDRFCGIVDFPFATLSPKIRQTMVIDAINLGYKKIDITVSSLMIGYEMHNKLYKDLLSIYKIAKDRGVTIRPIIEPKEITTSDVLNISTILEDIGFEYIICGTGTYVWDVTDSLIIANIIQKKTNLKVFLSANTLNKNQYSLQVDSGVFGVRFTSIAVAEAVLEKNLTNGV